MIREHQRLSYQLLFTLKIDKICHYCSQWVLKPLHLPVYHIMNHLFSLMTHCGNHFSRHRELLYRMESDVTY